jgi:hypothetical protein
MDLSTPHLHRGPLEVQVSHYNDTALSIGEELDLKLETTETEDDMDEKPKHAITLTTGSQHAAQTLSPRLAVSATLPSPNTQAVEFRERLRTW